MRPPKPLVVRKGLVPRSACRAAPRRGDGGQIHGHANPVFRAEVVFDREKVVRVAVGVEVAPQRREAVELPIRLGRDRSRGYAGEGDQFRVRHGPSRVEFPHHPFWETAVIICMYAEDAEVRSHIAVVSNKLFNSYPYPGTGYASGDFIVHFVGLKAPDREAAMRNYAAMAR
jgi:hypothetical protein